MATRLFQPPFPSSSSSTTSSTISSSSPSSSSSSAATRIAAHDEEEDGDEDTSTTSSSTRTPLSLSSPSTLFLIRRTEKNATTTQMHKLAQNKLVASGRRVVRTTPGRNITTAATIKKYTFPLVTGLAVAIASEILLLVAAAGEQQLLQQHEHKNSNNQVLDDDAVFLAWKWHRHEQQHQHDMNATSLLLTTTSSTHYSVIVPRITGSISTVSSVLMMYIILRSEPRLSSIYHRIMFGMCVADIMGSMAMALNTLPMPSYMSQEEDFGYYWRGSRLGNEITCNMQGVFVTFGIVVMFGYNAGLCIYYACAIALGMRDKVIKKQVEPFLHILPLLCGSLYAVPPLFYDLYNPCVGAFTWCCMSPYPDECGNENGPVDCLRGSKTAMNRFAVVLTSFICTALICIVVSMVMVIWKVFQTNRWLNKLSKIYKSRGILGPGCKRLQERNEGHRTTLVILVQVSCYLLASLAGIVPPMLRVSDTFTVDDGITTPTEWKRLVILDKVILVFLPLQGFFNFAIFVSHKIYNYRRMDRNASVSDVLGLLFRGSGHDPTIISRMSIVSIDHQEQLFEEGPNRTVLRVLEAQGSFDGPFEPSNTAEDEEGRNLRLELYQNYASQLDVNNVLKTCSQDDVDEKVTLDDNVSSEGIFMHNNGFQDNASISFFPSKSYSSSDLAESSLAERKYYKLNVK